MKIETTYSIMDELDDPMEDILAITVVNKELEHVPYKVTAEMIKKAVGELEDYNKSH